MSTASGSLPAGPFLRVVVIGAALTVGGQTLTADLGVDTSTTSATTVCPAVAATPRHPGHRPHRASFALPAVDPVLTLRNGSGTFLVSAARSPAS